MTTLDAARVPHPAPVRATRAHADQLVRTASTALLGGALLLVTTWWASDGGVTALGAWSTALTSVGQWTGLVASVLLLVQVLLMARLPLVEGSWGQDRLVHLHRWVGFSSFTLMLVHIVLITWGYAAGRLLETPGMFWQLVVDSPGMLLAAAGTVALVMVVVTSLRAARRRLRYESWHLMHLYAYLGVGLALPHQLWTGASFTSSPGRTLFWWSAWGTTAVAVLVWRVLLPLVRTLRHELVVAGVVHEAPDVVTVHLTGRHLHRMRVSPGQYFNWRFLDREGWTRANPYSISSAPDGRHLRVTIKHAGDGSSAASRLVPGSRVAVEGPYGRLTPRVRTRRKVALIGAGVGITPLRSLAEGLDYAPGEAVLLHRWTTEPLFAGELAHLGATRGLQVVDLPGRRRHPDSWLGDAPLADDTTLLHHWVPDLAERDVWVCGPGPWADAVRRSCLALGVPARRIHVESFGW
ncbi:ferric reductase-like transmembrane domain-containing protein [Nocardioides sp. J2M5]|uniref:ferredoxin reductase family protein n=1 Tax=Nocardioides palaemonis TaxID=2829810 RepID=UPI001BA57FE0|nr:ferredoxin reductase family protein [Nocardioides palaemonis]MBS2938627.1 ferric reductase-like transmembrane domain-containing protein [Nocardioides palaemonis]